MRSPLVRKHLLHNCSWACIW